jgi:hypothetical protein
VDLTTSLLIASLVLDLGLGAGLVLLWRQRGQSPAGKEDPAALLQGEMGRFERYLDGKVDLLLVEMREGASSEPASAEKVSAGAEEARPVGEPDDEVLEDRIPPNYRPRGPQRDDELSDVERLDLLLSSPDFRNGVWPRMDGPFNVAAAHLLGYLSGKGVAEPDLEPHPPVGPDYENHWEFMVVWPQDGGDGASRFLIPRNYSRYDPAVHDHLFQVLGGGASLENYIRELRRCALLRGTGPLEEFISPKLVDERGVLVVRDDV